MTNAQQHYDDGLKNLCKSQANKSKMWYGQAIRDFSEAISEDPDMTQALILRAVCYTTLGETTKADEDNAIARKLEASGKTNRQTDATAAKSYCEKARMGMENGGLISDSLYFLQKAIDADPSYADAYDARSDVYFNLGMADEAIEDIKRAGRNKKPEAKITFRPWWKFW
jgi:Tfp pilus assembly protein PilF